MAQPLFGTGLLVLTPTVAGTVTPVQVAVLESVSLDITLEEVLLYGNLQFPIDGAKGKGKISGKIKTGYFAGGLIQYILSGGTSGAGNNIAAFNEAWTCATTVTVSHSATWVSDLAVFDSTLNKYCTRGATATGSGIYAVTNGVYSFNAADVGHSLLISYDWGQPAVGTSISYANQMMGTTTTFGLKLYNQYNAASSQANSANGAGLYMPSVMLVKGSLPFKSNGYMEKDIDFVALANSAGNVFTAYTGN